MKAGKVFAFVFVIGAVLLSTECVGPGGGDGAYTTYTNSEYGYSFEYPTGWQIMSDEEGIVMIMSNDLVGSAMITAGIEEKNEYSYDNPYDLVDAMAEGFTSSGQGQIDGPYHINAAGHAAAEVFISYTVEMAGTEGTGSITMDVKYSILSIDGDGVFYNFMLTECLSQMCTQYPGVYAHLKDSFEEGEGGNGGNGGDVPDSYFDLCKDAAEMCVDTQSRIPEYDCTGLCGEHCSTPGDYNDIMTGEHYSIACEKSNSACGYCIAGDSWSIQKP